MEFQLLFLGVLVAVMILAGATVLSRRSLRSVGLGSVAAEGNITPGQDVAAFSHGLHDLTIVRANAPFLALFGRSLGEIGHFSVLDISDGVRDKVQAECDVLGRVIRARLRGPQSFAWRCRRRDGTSFIADVHLLVQSDDGTELAIWEIREAAECDAGLPQFDRVAAIHKVLFQHVPQAILIWQVHRDHVELWDANDHAQKLFGYTREEFLAIDPLAVSAPVQANGRPLHEEAVRYYAKMKEQPEGVSMEWLYRDRSGRIFPADVFWIKAPTSIGKNVIIGHITDITERKAVERKLANISRDQEVIIARRTAELERAMQQLLQSKKVAALGSLVAGISHELNTPLGNIVMAASSVKHVAADLLAMLASEQVRRTDLQDAARLLSQGSELIERNALRGADLISKFKQISVGQTEDFRSTFNLREVVDSVLQTLMPLVENATHRICCNIPEEIELDSFTGAIENVLIGLVSNAVSHAFEGREKGEICIDAATDGGMLILTVRDNGNGIAAANHEKIFDPFFTTRMGRGNSGLGLYIVHNIVSATLKGKISIESETGAGAKFVIVCPLLTPDRTET